MNIDFLKEQSKLITEEINVANTDDIINAVIEQKQYNSLAYQIAEVSPIYGPTAATFALVYIDDPAFPGKKKIALLRGEVQVEDDPIEDTGFTVEAVQDLQSQFGKSANEFIGKSFGGVSAVNENKKLIQKMSTFATASPNLVLSDPSNAETATFEIQQKVAEIVLLINQNSFKSLDSFVILTPKAAASMLAISNRLPNNQDERGLFLGANSRTKFYLNPDVTSTECFVGIHSEIPGQSSLIMSPYHHALKTATDPETGQEKIFNFNRYAITESKLSTSTPADKMLYKFSIS